MGLHFCPEIRFAYQSIFTLINGAYPRLSDFESTFNFFICLQAVGYGL